MGEENQKCPFWMHISNGQAAKSGVRGAEDADLAVDRGDGIGLGALLGKWVGREGGSVAGGGRVATGAGCVIWTTGDG